MAGKHALHKRLTVSDIDIFGSELNEMKDEDTRIVRRFRCTFGEDDEFDCYITDITVLPSGDIVCVDADNHVGKMFTKFGKRKCEFGRDIMKRPDKLTALKNADGTNSILISDLDEKCIFNFDASNGKLMGKLKSPSKDPVGLASTRDGNILITDWKTKEIYIVNSAGKVVNQFHSGLDWPVYAAASTNGNLVVSDWKSNHVRIYNQDGHCVQDYNEYGSETGEIDIPNGVICDNRHDCDIFVTDMGNKRIHQLSADGVFKRFVATHEHEIDKPTGITFNNTGELLVCDLSGTVLILDIGYN